MSWITKLTNLLGKRRYEAEMAEEMRAHLELREEQLRTQGHSAEEARRAARREFGGLEQLKERCRDGRALAWLEHFGRDLQHGARQLVRAPGFTLVAVCSLALAIGASTAIFTLVNDFLLRSLPVPEPERLVLLRTYAAPKGGSIARDLEGNDYLDHATGRLTGTSFPVVAYERFQKAAPAASEIFAFAPLYQANLLLNGQAELNIQAQVVSGNYYRGLGLRAVLGRTLSEADDRPNAAPVAVLSHRSWRARFQSDPAVVGRTVVFNRLPVTIVGVTPPGFDGALQVGDSADLTLPLALAEQLDSENGSNRRQEWFWWIRIMARLAPGGTPAQVQAALEPIFQQTAREGWVASQALEKTAPKEMPELPTLGSEPGAQGETDMRREYAPALHLLLAFVGLVLLAACANVANLLLARGAARRGEIAVRLALGAARSRIVRQLLTESLLLAGLSAALGVALAWASRGLLLILQPFGHATAQLDLPLDARVLAFAVGLTFATSLLFGLAPALRATRLDLSSEFHGSRTLGTRSESRLSRGLLVLQVALSLILLVGTGLILRSLWNLRGVDPGFRTQGLASFRVEMAPSGYDNARAHALQERLVERLRGMPGVQAATYARMNVLARTSWRRALTVEGHVPPPGADRFVFLNHLAPDFFDVLGMPLLQGRRFTGLEAPDAANKVVIINQTLARQYFGNANAVGRQVILGDGSNPSAPRAEVIGVVGDAKYTTLRAAVPPTLYQPASQVQGTGAAFFLRLGGEPSAVLPQVRAAVREIDPSLPVKDLRTFDEAIELLHAQETLFARLLGGFGVVAAILSCVGLHGLMSFAVTRRTSELGLRLMLGATQGQVMGLILRDSLLLVGLGVALGLGCAALAARVLTATLFGLSPVDPLTYAAMALLLLATALLASSLPAFRAARIDPARALREG